MNSIKTDILLGDNGKEYDLGRVTRKEMYLKTLSKEEALRLFDAGKRVYFIYLNNRIYKCNCRKICKSREYLIEHYDVYREFCGVPISMKVEISDFIDGNHRSHYWYGGECARIMFKGYTAEIRANGDVYAEYIIDGETKAYVKDKNNAGFFYNEMKQYLKDDAALYRAINEGSLLIDNNNWWEAFIIDPEGKFHDLMWDLDSSFIDEAVEEVKTSFDEMIKYIEDENHIKEETK